MQVIRQRYYMRDAPVYAWRPIDPYCIQEINYYDLTLHRSGDDGKGDRYQNYVTSGYTVPDGVMFQRRKADGTITHSELPNNARIPHPFIDNDIVATTVPLNKLKFLRARYHRVKQLLFNPSLETPNLEEFLFRGNWTEFGDLDMTNCTKLSVFDSSMCYINSLKLPPTDANDTSNYFRWAYIGHFDRNDRRQMPPISVVDGLTRRAYYSKMPISAMPGTAYKELNSDSGNSSLYINGLPMHKRLVQEKNWKVMHLSLSTFSLSFNGNGGNRTFEFMTSWHDWNIVIDVSWISVSQTSGPSLNSHQSVLFTIDNNDSGNSRSAVVKFRKIKRYPKTTGRTWEDGTEFHHHAELIITQSQFVPLEF